MCEGRRERSTAATKAMLSEEAAEQQQEGAGGSGGSAGPQHPTSGAGGRARGCHGGPEQHPAKQTRCTRSRYPFFFFFFPLPTTTTTKWEPKASRKAARGGKEAHLWRHSCRRGGPGAKHGGGGRDPAGGRQPPEGHGTEPTARIPRHGAPASAAGKSGEGAGAGPAAHSPQ